MPRRLVLLGDSILDNSRYTSPAPDTSTLLAARLGPEWKVTLLAQDGAMLDLLPVQLDQMPSPTDLAILSIGGNDLVVHLDLLQPRPTTTSQMLTLLANILDDFTERYWLTVREVQSRAAELAVCTIYEPPLDSAEHASMARVPLGLVNDQIVRVARRVGAGVIELRDVCTEPGDFTQQIEPSARGAAKIAEALAAQAWSR